MSAKALIFIPDISGYTEFVTQTENKHSNHILTELLEIIIQSNQLNLIVSEIEGDAVLFYRKGKPPAIEELVEQVKTMFINFHAHLKVIQRDNVCQCGACRSAVNLTLKFITHYGELNETVIQNFTKIVGGDVILAHRLLKNKLGQREYLLVTENYLSTQNTKDKKFESWVRFISYTESIENFNDVNTSYSLLADLKNEIPEVYPKQNIVSSKRDKVKSININAPILLVHELLTDIDAKMEYVPGIKSIESSHPINRIHGSHTCIFDDLQIHFVTQSNEVTNKKIKFVEEGELSIGVRFITDYKMEETENGTKLSVSIFPEQLNEKNISLLSKIINKIKTVMVIIKLKSATVKNINTFKEYCEKIYIQRKNEK